jgi:lipopolysaccharide/colanic/teichoic acid biosynthesis glycosyltransferase
MTASPDEQKPRPTGARVVKRVLDVVASVTGLVILAPVVALTAAAVWAAHGRPILFRQQRPGVRGEPFTILKFRTMRAPRAGEVWYETDALRVTALGRFLRTTSLDELPELWNVLRGDMSLVGPRPLLPEYMGAYTPEERRRHDVRPGLTGWAVVHGRNTLPFRERLRLDVWYVEHASIALDLLILARTVALVVRRSHSTPFEDDVALGFPTACLGCDTAVLPHDEAGQLDAERRSAGA